MSDNISRDVFEGVGPNGIDVRLYDTDSLPPLPSVTTVLKTRNDDKSNLYGWQNRNDGKGNNAYHKHLFWYSRQLGTLGHWYALSQLDDSLEWTDDEQSSLDELFEQTSDDLVYDSGHPKAGKRASPREILYSICRGDANKAGGTVSSWGEFYDMYPPYKNNNYYKNALIERAISDVEFFVEAQTYLWDKLGVTKDTVVSVEQYLFNATDGYAGQVDLIYEVDGTTVVADLKSSSGCYDKHQMQGAAYARSAEVCDVVDNVDRIEVHRAHPRTGQMVAHTHKDAPNKSAIHNTKYWNEGIESLWEQFESLISNFDDYEWDEYNIGGD